MIINDVLENNIKNLKDKESNFVMHYKVYKDLKNRGFYALLGFKYGADFLVYRDDPNFIHSEYLLFIYYKKTEINLKELISGERTSQSNKKKYLTAIVDENDNIEYYNFEWIG